MSNWKCPIRPFLVNIPEVALQDLKERIVKTRWPESIQDNEWSYGSNLDYIKELARYWSTVFDWKKIEDIINEYPNFIAEIDDWKVHFVHVKGQGKKSVPLIITHGWPGSFLEMMKIIPILTCNQDLSFDLVIPSVLGFGFSSKPTKPGCDASVVAGVWHKLMSRLGYEKYFVQGGDIGAGISTRLALQHPEHVWGLHLNFISGSFKPYIPEGQSLTDEEAAFQKIVREWSIREGAYSALQATKPLTLAYGLNDSPVGLCAWIVEKFKSWTDHDGNLGTAVSKDELLANITLYWLTESIGSSINIYRENSKNPLVFGKEDFVSVPTAFARFPRELPTPPRSYVKRAYNIQRWTEMPRGGHFAALEQPGLFSDDVVAFAGHIVSMSGYA